MSKLIAGALLAAVAALPAMAAQSDGIEVRADPSGWTQAMSRGIGDNLRYPYVVGADRQPSGIVRIAFRNGADGRPADVRVVQSSSFPALDKVAVAAIERAGAAHPAPASYDAARPLQAWVYFAQTEREERMLTRQLASEAANLQQTASAERPTLLIAGQ